MQVDRSKIRINSNYEKFPYNLLKPDIVVVDNKEFLQYNVIFNTLSDIYDYIKSNPEINSETFKELCSVTADHQQAGIPFNKAVEDLINDDEQEYFDFLDLIDKFTDVDEDYVHEYREIKTVAGGHLNNVDYARGAPLCYETYERVKEPKLFTIYSTLSYQWTTNKKQVLNRAIILVSLVKALEKSGYEVNLTAFALMQKYNELFDFNISVKNYGERINLQTLYKTSCKVEFLRRIVFRILETTSVHDFWSFGYGTTCEEKFVRELYNINEDAIYFGTPQELGITGNLERDFDHVLTKLNLKDKFDIGEISDEFKKNALKLIK